MILSGPSLTPATNAPLNAPLAGVLKLKTDVDSRISVLVSDGTETWQKNFYDFGPRHLVPLLGFKPGTTNQIQVTVYDKHRNAYTAPQLITFVTAPLPADFPHSVVLKSEPSQMEPGYTLFIILNGTTGSAYVAIVDNSGEVVWYSRPNPPYGGVDVRMLDNGNLFIEQGSPVNNFIEVNMLGEIVKIWNAPASYPVDAHDGVPTDHGSILYISDVNQAVPNFPTSVTDSNAPLVTTNVVDNPVVEISATNGALLNTWSSLALLDPTRVTYLTYQFPSPNGVDNLHANAVLEDKRDDSIIVSLRNQNAVFKFSRAGQLKWILAPHAGWSTNLQPYLLSPVGTPFEWNYGQHAPKITPQGTLLVYDDGSEKASPFDTPVADQDNYSRAVEYNINETNLQVAQVWDTTTSVEDRIFTPVVGNVQWLPQTRDVLVTYGYVTYVNGVHPNSYAPAATMVRIIEYTHDPVPQVVFDLSFFDYDNTNANFKGYVCYRSARIPDLYPHFAGPVTDLVLNQKNQTPFLQFSADPTHDHLIQASTDLTNWTTIGTPVQEGAVGNFDFQDLNANQFITRFYRVVTQPRPTSLTWPSP